MTRIKTLCFDTETTGFPVMPIETNLPEVQPRIIQIHAELIECGNDGSDPVRLEFLSTHLNSVNSIPKKITEITGITIEKLHGAPQWEDVRPQFWSMVEAADFTAAHNFPFDARMLQIEEMFIGQPKPFAGKKTRCSLMASRKVNTTAKSHALGNIYEHLFGEKFSGAHTADADVGALVRVYTYLLGMGAWATT